MATVMNTASSNTPRLVRRLLLVVILMFGFGYALVPLYDIFCEITGLNGKTGRVSAANLSLSENTSSRVVTVEFVATLNQNLPWVFQPAQQRMQVSTGTFYTTHYTAKNTAPHSIIGQAVPSVAPSRAATYFNKTECFCFTQQQLNAGEEKQMPIRFIIDNDLPENVSTVTLAYTFFYRAGSTDEA